MEMRHTIRELLPSSLFLTFAHFTLTVALISFFPSSTLQSTTATEEAVGRILRVMHPLSQALGDLLPFSIFGAILGIMLFTFDSLLWGFAVASGVRSLRRWFR